MFRIFQGKDEKRAAELIRLSKMTISQMEALLSDDRQSDHDRQVIQEHIRSRLDEIRVYGSIAQGRQDAFAKMISPLQHYDTLRQRMLNELAVYSGSASQFATFLRATASH